MEIKLDNDLDEKYYKLLDSEFDKHARKNGLECAYQSFTFTARDNGEVVGILTGHSYYDEVHISDLIVLEDYRGKHIGSSMMQAVEDFYKDKGFSEFTVNTYGFQAPEFYKKCGYEIEHIRENKKEPKLTKYYLVKYI